MQPDDLVPFDGATLDPELAALEAEFDAAGARVRTKAGPAADPAPIYAAALRTRLVDRLPRRDALVVPIAGEQAVANGKPWTVEASGKPWALPVAAGTAWRGPRPPIVRYAALAMAAVIGVIAFLGAGRLLFPVSPTVRAGDSVGAVLVRGGAETALLAGAELRSGDLVRTAADGHATLRIGGGETRLDGGAALRVEALSGTEVVLDQLAGRSWHRVALPDGARYIVGTGPLRWTTTGTAFDLSRTPLVGGGERVTLLAVEHDVTVRGADLSALVEQGSEADIILGGEATGSLAIGPLGRATLSDAWLLRNARLDARLGFPLGIMTGRVEAAPTPKPTLAPPPTTEPAAPPSGSPEASPEATPAPAPAPKPTPKPTARPTPTPTPTATPMPVLALTLTPCNGGVVIEWGAYGGDGFNHYTTLRNTSASIPLASPSQDGAVDLGGTYTTDPAKTSAFDAEAATGVRAYYRTMAFDAADQVTAASVVKSVVPKAVKVLGTLDVSGTSTTGVSFGWTAYGGLSACFDYYKLVYSPDDTTPSYLEGSPYLAAIGEQGASGTGPLAMDPGTYYFRLQAIRTTALGKFIVAQTGVTTFTVDP